MSKTINKAKLDEMFALTREFYESDDYEAQDCAIHKRIGVAQDIEKESNCHWLCLCDICSAVYKLKDDATNEDIYKVLEVLGWSVE